MVIVTYNENNKKYSVNNRFFSEWTNEMAYILGFIFADGNLAKDKYRLRISSIDLEILEKINSNFKSNRPIKTEHNTGGSWFTLTIDNRDIYNDLENLGVTPNKSLTCKVPEVPNQYKYDFIRGFFDGDGCVYAKYHKDSTIPTLALDIATGSTEFRDGYLSLLQEFTDPKHGCSVQVRKDGLSIIRINSTVAERIYNKMYYDGCLCLERKKEKFDEILKARQERKKKRSNSHKV